QVKTDRNSPLDTDGTEAGGGPLHGVLELRVGQPTGGSTLVLGDDGEPIRIRALVALHRGFIGVEPATRKPSREGDAGRGVHHRLVWGRPDAAQRLDE